MSYPYIGEKYIKQLSMYTDNFIDCGNNTFNCRCKICGDSKTNMSKARGYFYQTENQNWRYKCHNCAVNMSLSEYLKQKEPILYNDYLMEIFKEKGSNNTPPQKPHKSPDIKQYTTIRTIPIHNAILSVVKRISDLKDDHIAKQYLNKRRIPHEHQNQLYFVEDLKGIVDYIPQYKNKDVPNIKGIMIPFFQDNLLVGFQIRNLDNNSKLRYLTYDLTDNCHHIYNLNNILKEHPVYVFEGAFDSMCCINGVCASGASIMQKLEYIKTINKDVIVVFDNDYQKNKDILALLNDVIDKGYSVVIYDDVLNGYKDINQYIEDHPMTPMEVTQYLSKNTHNGLLAKLKLSSTKNKSIPTMGKVKAKKSLFSL